jgi:hypothetical protein
MIDSIRIEHEANCYHNLCCPTHHFLAPRHPESLSEMAPLGRRGCVTTTTIVCCCHLSTNGHTLSLGIIHFLSASRFLIKPRGEEVVRRE